MSEASPGAGDTSLRLFAFIGYGLFLFAFTNGITAVVGVVLAYIKRGEASGTPYASHFRNMIVVFWTALAMLALFIAALGFGAVRVFSGPLPHLPWSLIGLGAGVYFCAVAFVVWYFYRTIKGLMRALEAKPYA